MDRQDRGFRRGSSAPIKVGDEVDVTIEAVGEKGDGLAKISGFVLFVPGVKQGDKLKVKVTKVLRSVGFGEVVGPSTGGSDTSSKEKKSSKSDDGSDGDDYAEEDQDTQEESSEADSEDF